MKVLIVEDENLLARQLSSLLLTLEPGAQLLGRTNSIQSTIQWLNENERPDLILMDIELADGQCFEIFKRTTVKTPVIFTTAYDEYTLQAFKVNSIDYLLKPIKADELKAALEKFKELHATPTANTAAVNMEQLISQLQRATVVEYKDRFLVKQGQKMLSINSQDIALFTAKNTLNFIITKDHNKFVIDYSLDEIEAMVNPKQFFRANRQCILSNDIITAVHSWFNGKLKVDVLSKLENDIVISREKAPLFRKWMGE